MQDVGKKSFAVSRQIVQIVSAVLWMKWARYVARMGEKINTCRVLVGEALR
jgi:hypothetical protein